MSVTVPLLLSNNGSHTILVTISHRNLPFWLLPRHKCMHKCEYIQVYARSVVFNLPLLEATMVWRRNCRGAQRASGGIQGVAEGSVAALLNHTVHDRFGQDLTR